MNPIRKYLPRDLVNHLAWLHSSPRSNTRNRRGITTNPISCGTVSLACFSYAVFVIKVLSTVILTRSVCPDFCEKTTIRKQTGLLFTAQLSDCSISYLSVYSIIDYSLEPGSLTRLLLSTFKPNIAIHKT